MSQTLVLNASYEPMYLLPLRKALKLVLSNKAEIIVDSDDIIRSAHTSVSAPNVIRLKRYVKIPYRARVPLNARSLRYRDAGECQYCGKPGNTMDHVIPQSHFANKREATYWENVVLACRTCNGKKSNKTLAQMGWTLKRKPAPLVTQAWFIIGITVDPAWEPFIPALAA